MIIFIFITSLLSSAEYNLDKALCRHFRAENTAKTTLDSFCQRPPWLGVPLFSSEAFRRCTQATNSDTALSSAQLSQGYSEEYTCLWALTSYTQPAKLRLVGILSTLTELHNFKTWQAHEWKKARATDPIWQAVGMK